MKLPEVGWYRLGTPLPPSPSGVGRGSVWGCFRLSIRPPPLPCPVLMIVVLSVVCEVYTSPTAQFRVHSGLPALVEFTEASLTETRGHHPSLAGTGRLRRTVGQCLSQQQGHILFDFTSGSVSYTHVSTWPPGGQCTRPLTTTLTVKGQKYYKHLSSKGLAEKVLDVPLYSTYHVPLKLKKKNYVFI